VTPGESDIDRAERGLRIVDPRAGVRTFDRSDVVLRKGQFTLLNQRLTPQQATIEDLLAIADVLDAAGIELLLIRGDRSATTLAVDAKRRSDVARVLAVAFANEPFYSKVSGQAALFIADGRLSSSSTARILTLFRPRIDPSGRLRYGASNGVRLEFWKFGLDEIVAPAPNAVMRPTIPRQEAVEATVELHGREWRTIAGMYSPLVSDVTFDIDIVFSWVDGSSAEFQRARAQRMKTYVVGEGDDSEARYRQLDELKYALRSVYLYAPWVRRIFIVTDSPVPTWLDEHPSVTIVRSEDFFLDHANLPTHNSHAIESQLQHIEGLSEHFLYSNDDMFFARPVSPDTFFSPGGVTRFIEATTRIGLGENNPERSGFENAARVNRDVLKSRFGRVTTRHLEHAPTPLRKSVLLEMEREFPAEFARTAASPFRSSTDISVTNSLYHYYALMTGRAVIQTDARVTYVETTLKSALRQMRTLLRRRDQTFFCLNDGSVPEISIETRTQAVLDFLNRYFPIPAPWEKPEVDSVAPTVVTPSQGSASS
jgi:Stealth protein CR2, conserved region 2/Stealth protein CR3, conserved region 3/Stealth protein CR4, conserved region 4/Stealth protein CR1, conserved region 1